MAILLGSAPVPAAQRAPIVVDAASASSASSDLDGAWRPASLTKLETPTTLRGVAAGHLLRTGHPHCPGYAAPAALRASNLRGRRSAWHHPRHHHRSANDAAVVLAERVGGDETSFAGRMTATGKRLGMTGSNFRNATGLPDPEQTTTAHDMAVLALALLHDFPQYYHYFSAHGMTYLGSNLPSINAILYLYPGADGLKTGFTCGSGYNLVASALRDGKRVIGVLRAASPATSASGACACCSTRASPPRARGPRHRSPSTR
jgi:D-alanyl-D-alanine carboxypeptidase